MLWLLHWVTVPSTYCIVQYCVFYNSAHHNVVYNCNLLQNHLIIQVVNHIIQVLSISYPHRLVGNLHIVCSVLFVVLE